MSHRYWTHHMILAAANDWTAQHGRIPRARDWRNATVNTPSAQTVMEVFGSWNRMLTVSGIEPRRPHQKSSNAWTRRTVVNAMLDWFFHFGRWPSAREWAYALKGGEPCRPHYRTVVRLFGSWTAAKRASGWDGEGRCKKCGCPRSEFVRGCKTCIQRRRYRLSKSGPGVLVESASPLIPGVTDGERSCPGRYIPQTAAEAA